MMGSDRRWFRTGHPFALAVLATVVLAGTAVASTVLPDGRDVAQGGQAAHGAGEAGETPPTPPPAVQELARVSSELLTSDLHRQLHEASRSALSRVDWDEFAGSYALDLLLVPPDWMSLEEVFQLVDRLDGQVELTAVHVAFAGDERTTVGVIQRLAGTGWEETLKSWDEFFTASMRENRETTSERLAAPGEEEAAASDLRYLQDVESMLTAAEGGDYPVYAFSVGPTASTDPSRAPRLTEALAGLELGGFVIPRGRTPSVLTPPEDPARDRYIMGVEAGT